MGRLGLASVYVEWPTAGSALMLIDMCADYSAPGVLSRSVCALRAPRNRHAWPKPTARASARVVGVVTSCLRVRNIPNPARPGPPRGSQAFSTSPTPAVSGGTCAPAPRRRSGLPAPACVLFAEEVAQRQQRASRRPPAARSRQALVRALHSWGKVFGWVVELPGEAVVSNRP